MSIRDHDHKDGTVVPGSGTTSIPMYHCPVCRDAGIVSDPDRHGDFIPCSYCDGKSRLAGEIDDTVPTPFLHLQHNLRHGGPS